MNKPEKLPIGVYQKLQQARIVLQSKQLKKSGNNKFAGYTYFELGDFLPTVNQIFADLGLFSQVSYTPELATLRIIDTADGSEVVFTSPMASAALKGCHEIQNLGAVETYQRRYLYVTAMEIVEHDALDATTGSTERASAKSVSADVWDNLPADEQEFLQGIADQVLAAQNAKEALQIIEGTNLDADEKAALWSRLDSKTRSAIKKAKEAA